MCCLFTHRPSSQGELDGVQVGDRTPHLSDQTLLSDVDVAEVEGVVDGLHLPHLDEPHPHGLGGGLQNALAVVLGLVQHLQGQVWFRSGILVRRLNAEEIFSHKSAISIRIYYRIGPNIRRCFLH